MIEHRGKVEPTWDGNKDWFSKNWFNLDWPARNIVYQHIETVVEHYILSELSWAVMDEPGIL